jgi:TM2 domain-containing membrane protein YozV
MVRICSKCQITYGRAPNNLLTCPRCGDEWSTPFAANTDREISFLGEQSRDGDCGRLLAEATVPQTSRILTANSQPEVGGSLSVSQQKSPALAALLSFLLVGMGQVYLGQVEKGLCLLVLVLLFVMNSVPGPLGLVLLLLNVLDAFLMGRKVKNGRQIRKWQFFFSRNERWQFQQFNC